MVSFFDAQKKVAAPKAIEVQCESLDIQGRGVCKHDGVVYFVDNLMPGEKARVVPIIPTANAKLNAKTGHRSKPAEGKDNKVLDGRVSKLLEPSPERRAQSCPLQERCGGCPLEHLPKEMSFEAKIAGFSSVLCKNVAQGTKSALSHKASQATGSSKLGKNSTIKQALANKQAALKNEQRQKEIKAAGILAARAVKDPKFKISGDETYYRRACRLAIRGDHGKLHLGFRASGSQDLVPVTACEVLTKRNNELLEPLKVLVNRMEGKKNIGHVELLDSDGAVGVLLRMTKKLDAADETLLKDFGDTNKVVVSVLEPFKQLDDTEVVRERILNEHNVAENAGYEANANLKSDALNSEENANAADMASVSRELYINAHDCKIYCSPSSFVQVNAKMNNEMIAKVLEEVAPHEGQKVLDLFSGLGNFSLPIAKAGASVVGIDIVSDMVRRANNNARLNGISEEKARFFVADLEDNFESQLWAKDQYDVVVMDPGRMGAKRAVSFMEIMKPKKIVMISCNPLAAARDCSQLLASNYKIESWGAFDMFPRTTHMEIMLTFTLNEKD